MTKWTAASEIFPNREYLGSGYSTPQPHVSCKGADVHKLNVPFAGIFGGWIKRKNKSTPS